MPLIATRGAASAQGFGEFAQAVVPTYIEDVFSTYLYTGTSATQTITNGIDLAGKGGLAWTKYRSGTNVAGHFLADSVRGISKTLQTNSEGGEQTTSYFTAFNSNGFSISSTTEINYLNTLYVSWTFRKQTKFFDIITYTGNGTSGTNIAHNLGSTPGCVMVKSTSTGRRWAVYHRGNGATPQNNFLNLNTTGASIASSVMWNNTAPTSTVFTLGSGTVVDAPTGEVTSTNENGVTYVAYIFAHDAGGFGLTGTDNVISCGSYAGTGSNVVVNLGWEPQWVMIKNVTTGGGGYNWLMADNMRGIPMSGNTPLLKANLLDAEDGTGQGHAIELNPTGFTVTSTFGALNNSSNTYIYIAIRRGPMKVPTSATTVFSPITNSATTGTVNTTGFPVDMGIVRWRTGTDSNFLRSRLQGVSSTTTESGAWLKTNATDAESTVGGLTRLWNNTGFQTTSGFSTYSTVYWNFGRAPSFFDEVCYTGTGSATTFTHNLGVVPELIIVKARNRAEFWICYQAALGNAAYVLLNSDGASSSGTYWNNTSPTSSVFSVSGNSLVGGPYNYVAYLFATCSGVSKVGSYTGTGTTKQIDCGFTAGARFVLIKRTDSTGDWYVWDSARGIIAGNDPYLLLNSTAAEVTNTDYVDTAATGFEISSTAPAAINANGGSFIFLAIA